ncbi:Raf serine/threonine-protein kinase phl [Tetrabaena socialis]|uniref:Raf serine/threonine-protein kinase phl n=1 Tax=Tetrabaena socialis TaxID=47790 RepID=A0A2J7ZVX3_9CHLO|nr:Raf serine/threonine-protein kinase phl [Tetrabaena socialis]|eukprot:PNH04398.1 Raf serine/threonine-protein kinase phl [Tetrabaena socialis]
MPPREEIASQAVEAGEDSAHLQGQAQKQPPSGVSILRADKAGSAAVGQDASRRAVRQASLRPAALFTVTDLLNSTVAGSLAAVGGAGEAAVERPPDMLAELDEMSKRLRDGIRDKALALEGIVGSGSFGTVYKGTWQGLPVAVKTVVFAASAAHRRRALQEAALCQSITHPNIVATYTSDVEPILAAGSPVPSSLDDAAAAAEGEAGPNLSRIMEWRLYIVQEYCDGGPLRSLYGARHIWGGGGAVDMPSILGIALGIARAVAHLHSKRIIHGDLNPNNVLLKRDAGEPCGFAVKVGDFGLSTLHCLQRQPQNRPPATEVEECLQWLLTAQVYGAGAGLQGRASVVDPSGLPWGQPGPGR